MQPGLWFLNSRWWVYILLCSMDMHRKKRCHVGTSMAWRQSLPKNFKLLQPSKNYQSLLDVIIQRVKEPQSVYLINSEGQRETAGLSLEPKIKKEDGAFLFMPCGFRRREKAAQGYSLQSEVERWERTAPTPESEASTLTRTGAEAWKCCTGVKIEELRLGEDLCCNHKGCVERVQDMKLSDLQRTVAEHDGRQDKGGIGSWCDP
ncbi:uncharacterized protein LOC129176658 [Dunckerocampus dactyliophorus]|uniref:uncharacterized protein LOC129176658 n=1 Tax=Dunckerocampus dactyliophorus TaxID=161453 RepID=UPI002404ADB8|nr:uncharacterized protein LOC129176658 [Dunckerocampus dactyliophorus]